MTELLDRHTQGRVYEQANNPWPGGNFKIEVYKDGEPRVTSGLHSIHLQMPLEVRISGDAASSFLQMKLACTSRFTTIGEVELTPRTAGRVEQLSSNITLPIPPAEADCGTMKLPIDAYLKAVVAQSKPKWEQDIDKKLNDWLSEGGAAVTVVPSAE